MKQAVGLDFSTDGFFMRGAMSFNPQRSTFDLQRGPQALKRSTFNDTNKAPISESRWAAEEVSLLISYGTVH